MLESFGERYGMRSGEIVADFGYGNEENYACMEDNGIDVYVKYNMFYVEMERRYANKVPLVQNMCSNASENYYVYPMGLPMKRCATKRPASDFGYRSGVTMYRAVNSKRCPLRGMCTVRVLTAGP